MIRTSSFASLARESASRAPAINTFSTCGLQSHFQKVALFLRFDPRCLSATNRSSFIGLPSFPLSGILSAALEECTGWQRSKPSSHGARRLQAAPPARIAVTLTEDRRGLPSTGRRTDPVHDSHPLVADPCIMTAMFTLCLEENSLSENFFGMC